MGVCVWLGWTFGFSPLFAAAPEVRGTWLTTTGPDHIASGNNTADTMNRLRSVGLNTVYVEAWKSGYTNFPSQTLASLTNGPDRSPLLGTTRDLLEETSLHAHRNSLITIGWFEYGFATQFVGAGGTPTNPISNYMKNQGWLLQDVNGNYANASNGFAWMNPAVPEVRQFLIDITLEAIATHDLDGVQFDDRLAWPTEFGWDQTTKNIYFTETGRTLTNNPNSHQLSLFNSWRQQKVQQFADELYTAVKAFRPDIHVSVSPSIFPFSRDQYNADWPDWLNAGLFDEYVPQVYRSSVGSYLAEIPNQVSHFSPNNLDRMVVGLRSVGTGNPTPYNDLRWMIEDTRSRGVAGHSIWYSQGVLDLYETELTSFYDVAQDGHAFNPMFPADHRPDPLPGTFLGSANWRFDVPESRGYRIVGRVTNGDWESLGSFVFEAGTVDLFLPGIVEAELIVDNRPGLTIQGDLDGDGFVGITDLNIILSHWNSSVTAGDLTAGDATGDGFVGINDLNLILGKWNTGTPPSDSAYIPEPTSAALILLGTLGTLTGRGRHRH
ncbi:MAG: hypothetical protein Kow00105_17820 [Phycisphaeraceae bacterium]